MHDILMNVYTHEMCPFWGNEISRNTFTFGLCGKMQTTLYLFLLWTGDRFFVQFLEQKFLVSNALSVNAGRCSVP